MNGLRFKPSLGDYEDEKFEYSELYEIPHAALRIFKNKEESY